MADSNAPIPMLDVVGQNAPIADDLKAIFAETLESGRFILGPEVSALESELAAFVGAAHGIGVSSGTDALLVALMALDIGPGDEVVTTPFTFFATGGCIDRVGATPVFVDIDPLSYNLDPHRLEAAITERTKAVMPVHLFGQSCDMRAISEVLREAEARVGHSIAVIEDAAQSLGSESNLGMAGSVGTFGCFSFFPSKNLGALGDGGLVITNDDVLAEKTRVLRAHGSKPKYFHSLVGGNFRLDALQAALLRRKFQELPRWTQGRRDNAAYYTERFRAAGLDPARLTVPDVSDGHVFNQYVLRSDRRDALQNALKSAQIGNAIYYPRSLHEQACFSKLGYKRGDFPHSEKAADEVLAIPVFGGLGDRRRERVADEVLSALR